MNSVVVTQAFKLNNVALKYLRDSHENPPGNPTTGCVDLTLSDPLQIGVIEKSTGNMYKFKKGEAQPWSWRQTLAALSREAKDLVLGAIPANTMNRTIRSIYSAPTVVAARLQDATRMRPRPETMALAAAHK